MRKRLLLIALVILALGLVGTGLSTIYELDEFIVSQSQQTVTIKVSYGFPLGWHGYSFTGPEFPPPIMPTSTPTPTLTYWFLSGSLALDVAFWFGISFFVCVVAVKLEGVLRKTMASKIVSVNMVLAYFFSSLTFMVVGTYLFSVTQNFEGFITHPYVDLSLRLCAIGLFLMVATYYQSLVEWRRTPQKSKMEITSFREIFNLYGNTWKKQNKGLVIFAMFLLAIGLFASFYKETHYVSENPGVRIAAQNQTVTPYLSVGIVLIVAGIIFLASGFPCSPRKTPPIVTKSPNNAVVRMFLCVFGLSWDKTLPEIS